MLAALTTGGALFALGHGQVEMAAPALAVVAAAALGSLVPDIDHPKAWISSRIPLTLIAYGLVFLMWFGFSNWYASGLRPTVIGASLWISLVDMSRPLLGWAVLALVLGVALLALASTVAAIVEHRGPTHSLGACAVLTLMACVGCAVAGQPLTLGAWFGWGYLSHLLADLATPMGCPALLWLLRSGDLSALRDADFSRIARTAFGRLGTSIQSTTESEGRGGGSAAPSYSPGHASSSVTLRPQVGEVRVDTESPVERAQPATPLLIEAGTESAASDYPPAGPSTSSYSRACPRCGGALIMREARRGAHVGNKFYGCANFPKCRYVENVAG